MVNYSYRLSEKADDDFARLTRHGLLNFGLVQSDKYNDGLKKRFKELADNPYLYQAVDHIREGYRHSVYGSHTIYYLINGNIVEIIRIIGQENIEEAF